MAATYTVRPGDTLSGIAEGFGAALDPQHRDDPGAEVEDQRPAPVEGLLAGSSGFGPAWRVDGGKIVSLTA